MDVQYKYKNRKRGTTPLSLNGLSDLGRQWSSSSSVTSSVSSPIIEVQPVDDFIFTTLKPAGSSKQKNVPAPIVTPKHGDVDDDETPMSPSVSKMREMFQKSP